VITSGHLPGWVGEAGHDEEVLVGLVLPPVIQLLLTGELEIALVPEGHELLLQDRNPGIL